MKTTKKTTRQVVKKSASIATKTATKPATPINARALVVSLTHVDPKKYDGWDGRNGCYGCGIDAARIAEALRLTGYQITALADKRAKKNSVLKALQKLAAETKPGDTFFFYYSGHGGQMPDTSGDEAKEAGGRPGADETLVLYDSELVDDLLDEVWKSFPTGSVVYMLSDSCNSGTNYRGAATRGATPIRPISRNVSTKMKAALLHVGGCRDSFTAAGEDDGGVFTKALLQAWNGGRGPGNWKDLHEAVCSAITGQIPQINTYGKNAKKLLAAPPMQPWATIPAPSSPSEPRGKSAELPISEQQARKATRWMMDHFGEKLRSIAAGTPFGPEIFCAIACQETAFSWVPMLTKLELDPQFTDNPNELVDLILSRCVLHASGDASNTSRSAFPKNTVAFTDRFGASFANRLIEEANLARALRGYQPKRWVYKGYGIFQYDLQFVLEDEDFFRERRWHDFDACLAKCFHELQEKRKKFPNDLWEAIRAYNGSGAAAVQYRENVRALTKWTADEISKMPAPTASRTRGAATARSGNLPSSKPKMTQAKLTEKLASFQLDRTKYPLIVVGIRGYYKDTMGVSGVNDRGIYDDAIFIDTPDAFAAFNGNTDPSKHKPGSGFNAGKGMAKLKPGAWFAHKLDFHGSQVFGPYRAICQRLGKVTVIRDGKNGSDYEDTGDFGINIHKGSYNGTSSLGCQTIHPDQWQSFISMSMDLAKRYYGDRWEKTVIPYLLIED